MLPILTQIDIDTAAEWLATLVRWREAKLSRQGHRTSVSLGDAVIDLLKRKNGPSTRIAISRGRFDERNESYRPGKMGTKRKNVYIQQFADFLETGERGQSGATLRDLVEALNGKERDILALRAAGHTLDAIGRQYGVSAQTAHNWLESILEKIRKSL